MVRVAGGGEARQDSQAHVCKDNLESQVRVCAQGLAGVVLLRCRHAPLQSDGPQASLKVLSPALVHPLRCSGPVAFSSKLRARGAAVRDCTACPAASPRMRAVWRSQADVARRDAGLERLDAPLLARQVGSAEEDRGGCGGLCVVVCSLSASQMYGLCAWQLGFHARACDSAQGILPLVHVCVPSLSVVCMCLVLQDL